MKISEARVVFGAGAAVAAVFVVLHAAISAVNEKVEATATAHSARLEDIQKAREAFIERNGCKRTAYTGLGDAVYTCADGQVWAVFDMPTEMPK